jgi:hypothetical protein
MGVPMKLASEHRAQAEACRVVARTARNATSRAQLLRLAEQWDNLAAERERSLEAQKPARDGKSVDAP